MGHYSQLTIAPFPDRDFQHEETTNGILDRLDISISQNWILATDTTEFLCDLDAFDIFYRPIITDDPTIELEAERHYYRAILQQGTHSERSLGENRRRGYYRGQVCDWKLWTEPDDTNGAAQIVVTSPEGEHHYLIAPETFRTKLEQRKEWLYEDYQENESANAER